MASHDHLRSIILRSLESSQGIGYFVTTQDNIRSNPNGSEDMATEITNDRWF